jgi:hypothetical protein
MMRGGSGAGSSSAAELLKRYVLDAPDEALRRERAWPELREPDRVVRPVRLLELEPEFEFEPLAARGPLAEREPLERVPLERVPLARRVPPERALLLLPLRLLPLLLGLLPLLLRLLPLPLREELPERDVAAVRELEAAAPFLAPCTAPRAAATATSPAFSTPANP